MVGPLRAFGPWDVRQQSAATLIYSEDDWRRAVTLALARSELRAFVLSKDFVVSRPLVIPAGLAGLRVAANPGVKISPKVTVDQLFKVQAPDVEIAGVCAQSISSARQFLAFLALDDSLAGATRVTVDRCRYANGGLTGAFVTSPLTITHGMFAARIINNIIEGASPAIALGDTDWLISGNENTNTLGSIFVGAGGGNGAYTRVLGNSVYGASIDVTSVSGKSIVDDNTNCGAIVAGGPGDLIGINT